MLAHHEGGSMTFEFSCEQCQKNYALPYERIKGRVLKVRCKQCKYLMVVTDPKRTEISNEPSAEPQTMGAQTLFSLQAIPSREEEEARLSAHQTSNEPSQPAPIVSTLASSMPPPLPPPMEKVDAKEPNLNSVQDVQDTQKTTAQISKTYRSENSVKVEVPKPTEEWAQEVAADLDRPITREIKIDQIQGVRSDFDFRPIHVRYMPHFLILALLVGLGMLVAPYAFKEQAPKKKATPTPVKEMTVTLNETALKNRIQSNSQPIQTEHNLPAQNPVVLAQSKDESSKTKETNLVPIKKESIEASSKPNPIQPVTQKKSQSIKRKSKTTQQKPGLPQASIQQIVQQNTGSLTYCYQKVQKKASIGPVKTRLSFKVLPNGSTQATSISLSGTYRNSKLEKCIALAVQRWRFPSAEGESQVRYPLNFTSGF